jgi:hypothetical protein
MSVVPKARPRTVSDQGAAAGCVLWGIALHNRGLRLRISQDQAKGQGGPITGSFRILEVGHNKHSRLLATLLHWDTDAAEVLRVLRRQHRACVSVVNANVLAVEPNEAAGRHPSRGEDAMIDANVERSPRTPEPMQPPRKPGNVPEGEPGKEGVRPAAERPPKRREGTVSDPDQYADEPLPKAESPPRRGVGTVSNPDF